MEPAEKNPTPHSTELLDGRDADLKVGICPYYLRNRGKGLVYCECARFRFPDAASCREILYRFCAHPTGYKSCVLKIAMDNYYERKYEEHEA